MLILVLKFRVTNYKTLTCHLDNRRGLAFLVPRPQDPCLPAGRPRSSGWQFVFIFKACLSPVNFRDGFVDPLLLF